eukprot:COSAG01_NODE_9012_length_2583_cov_3.407005_3_plen_98_part_00
MRKTGNLFSLPRMLDEGGGAVIEPPGANWRGRVVHEKHCGLQGVGGELRLKPFQLCLKQSTTATVPAPQLLHIPIPTYFGISVVCVNTDQPPASHCG